MASQNSASRMYSDVDPHCEWVEGEDLNTLMVDVSEFKKEQLKAQVDTSKNLKVSGERNITGNKWYRFQKSFQLPKTSEISKIRAKFDNGTLYVMVPKTSALNPTPSQKDKTTTTTTTMSTGEGQSNETKGNSLPENNGYSQNDEDMQQQYYNPEQPGRGVVKKCFKQKLVILNVVIAAILLVLVLFRRYKLADGDSIGGHKSNTQIN